MPEFNVAEILKLVPQAAESAFEKAEYDRRLTALRQEMSRKGFDLLLTSGSENIFYLTGQQTPGYYAFQCLGIPLNGEPFLVLRGLESMNAKLKSVLTDIEGYADDTPPAVALAASLKRRGWIGKRVAIDRNSWFLTVNLFDKIVQECGELLDGSWLIDPLRRIKSRAELEQIEKAGVANDAGMRAGLKATRIGVSENDIAADIMSAAIRAGSEYLGMEPFVTSGARGGVPHTTWRRKTIETSDVIALETCACYNRYHAALFRTVAAGKIPQRAEDMFKVCLEGLDAAIEKLRPGNTCADVHNATQAVIDKHGFTESYRKRTGYSIGISFAPDWGEGNILSLFHDVDVPLKPGMVFHVPVALREYAKFTAAVSETVIVTDGAPRTLSKIGREMLRV
jgi:Xaa-Pro dipeptidase